MFINNSLIILTGIFSLITQQKEVYYVGMFLTIFFSLIFLDREILYLRIFIISQYLQKKSEHIFI